MIWITLYGLPQAYNVEQKRGYSLGVPRLELIHHHCNNMERITGGLLAQFRSEFQVSRLAKGEVLFREQEAERFFYVIQEGTVRLTKMGASGKEITLDYRKRGQYLDGNSAFSVHGAIHFVTAALIEDGVILSIPIYRLQEILRENPDLTARLMGCQTCMMKKYVTTLSHLLFYEKEMVLQYTLYKIALEHGIKTEEGILITLPLTQSDLALHVGGSREFVNKAFSQLEERGILLRKKRREILIKDFTHFERVFRSMEIISAE